MNEYIVMKSFLKEFLEEEEVIAPKEAKCSYDEKNKTLFLNHADYKEDSITSNNILVRLNETENEITLKQEIKIKSDFRDSAFDDALETYRVRSIQYLTRYKVHDNTLDVCHASFSQSAREDSLGGGDWPIIDICGLNDFLDTGSMDCVCWAPNLSDVKYEKKSYTVPEGYSIKDGLNGVKEIDSAKVISKK